MHHHISLTDNTTDSLTNLAQHNTISVYQDLDAISGVSFEKLCAQNESLLIFPHCFGQNDDGIEEQHIFDFEGSPKYEENKIISVDDVKIKTGNLMGFIGFVGKGFHNTKVEIRSRFTENSSQDFFLHYMLEKVFNINLFNLNYSHGKNDGFDFIYLIFPVLLNRSVRQGIFRQYQTYEKNDANVKGPINVSRHIRQNVPFGGKIAYRSREYSFDNPLTQLIRHTIEYIKTKDFGRELLSNSKETKNAVSQIVEVTNQTFQPQQRQNIISKNIRPINHPYYSEYANLQKLCLMILNHHKIQFSATQSPIYGILSDGAWLWEEYLATVLKPVGFEHPENKTGKGGISLYRSGGGVRYPDFYRKKTESQRAIVFDAKYKALAYEFKKDDDTFAEIKIGFRRDDIHQIVTYMYILRAEKGAFIFPEKNRSEQENTKIRTLPNWRELKGHGGKVNAFGLVIPTAEDYKSFKAQMRDVERELMERVIEV